MKIGYRRPSVKKSFKARTTGKLKRKAKKAINPLYGKKGMGYINNPKKAVYNKIYNKTTRSVFDTHASNSNHSSNNHSANNLNSLTVAELKEMLRANGLKVSGTKQELIERLADNLQSVPTDETTYNKTNNIVAKIFIGVMLTFCIIILYNVIKLFYIVSA